MVERTYKITGLDCLECARGLEASVANLPDVVEAQLQYFNNTLIVRGDVDEKSLRKMITQLGYSVEDETNSSSSPDGETGNLAGFWHYLLQQR